MVSDLPVDTKTQVSLPGWLCSRRTVAHFYQESMLPMTPKGEDWGLVFGTRLHSVPRICSLG